MRKIIFFSTLTFSLFCNLHAARNPYEQALPPALSQMNGLKPLQPAELESNKNDFNAIENLMLTGTAGNKAFIQYIPTQKQQSNSSGIFAQVNNNSTNSSVPNTMPSRTKQNKITIVVQTGDKFSLAGQQYLANIRKDGSVEIIGNNGNSTVLYMSYSDASPTYQTQARTSKESSYINRFPNRTTGSNGTISPSSPGANAGNQAQSPAK